MNRNRTTHQSIRLEPITKKPVKSIEQQARLIKLRASHPRSQPGPSKNHVTNESTRVFANPQERANWLRRKNKRIVSIEKQLQIAKEDGVQSFLAIFSENIDAGRNTFYNFGPQAAMVFQSPEGIAFVNKWHEVMNLYQKERRTADPNMQEGSSLEGQRIIHQSVTPEDENESEDSMENEYDLVEEDCVFSITLPVIIASTPSTSPEGQPLVEENARTVPTTTTPLSIVFAATQSNSTTLPMTSRGGEVFRSKAEVPESKTSRETNNPTPMNQDETTEMLAAITRRHTIKNATDRNRKLRARKREEAGNPGKGSKCFVKINGVRVKSTSKKNVK